MDVLVGGSPQNLTRMLCQGSVGHTRPEDRKCATMARGLRRSAVLQGPGDFATRIQETLKSSTRGTLVIDKQKCLLRLIVPPGCPYTFVAKASLKLKQHPKQVRKLVMCSFFFAENRRGTLSVRRFELFNGAPGLCKFASPGTSLSTAKS